MWVVDLRGAASVAFGATLSQRLARPVAPVMTFNNWPADCEVVPAEQTLAALVAMRPRRSRRARWRRRPSSSSTPGASPSATRSRTSTRSTTATSSSPRTSPTRPRSAPRASTRSSTSSRIAIGRGEEDDFHEVAQAYQAAGLGIALADFRGALRALPEPAPDRPDEVWAGCFDRWSFTVGARSTVFDDPASTCARAAASEACAPPRRGPTCQPPRAWARHTRRGPPTGRPAGGRAYSGAPRTHRGAGVPGRLGASTGIRTGSASDRAASGSERGSLVPGGPGRLRFRFGLRAERRGSTTSCTPQPPDILDAPSPDASERPSAQRAGERALEQ